jgi:hypothetical protein
LLLVPVLGEWRAQQGEVLALRMVAAICWWSTGREWEPGDVAVAGKRGLIRYAKGRLSSTRVGKTDGERPPVNYPTDCSVLPLHFQPLPDFLQFLLTLHISEPFFSDEFISQIGRGVSITCS